MNGLGKIRYSEKMNQWKLMLNSLLISQLKNDKILGSDGESLYGGGV